MNEDFDNVLRDVGNLLNKKPMEDFIIVGGVSVYLYKLHKESQRQGIFTYDLDLACIEGIENTPDIFKSFSKIGFENNSKQTTAGCGTGHSGEVTKLINNEFEVEFLISRKGNSSDKVASLHPGEGGVHAQKIKYLDPLYNSPLIVHALGSDFRVPNPVDFIYQKCLIQRPKKKDSLYMYEVFMLFRDELETMCDYWEAVKKTEHHKWVKRAELYLRSHFIRIKHDSDYPTGVQYIESELKELDQDVNPERIYGQIKYFIDQVFSISE